MRDADVVITGAGPAGATVALNLAPTRRVVLVERHGAAVPRIGEALPPAARRLLADMGLLAAFEQEGHAPYHGNRAMWGRAAPADTDFLRGLDGPGWHLDRARFDAWLRDAARARGAELIAPARIEGIERRGDGWRVSLTTADGPTSIAADLLIDAGGRAAPVGRRLGAHRRAHDRLVCGWLYGSMRAPEREAGWTHVEACEHGWWYTSPLPGGRRVLAFHTDSDLPAVRIAQDRDALLACANEQHELARLLADCGFVPGETAGFTAAHTSVLTPCAGPGWRSVGDAALALDPLSSQGLLNALFTGLAVAEATDRYLAGDDDALAEYIRTVDRIRDAYLRDLARWYGAETRWPASPFWQRRHAPTQR